MQIMVSIGGYGAHGAEPVTLLALRDARTGVLAVHKKVSFKEAPLPGFAFVTNLRLSNYDCFFREQDFSAAIRTFRECEGAGTIVLSDETARYRPRIETDGINESGQKYRLATDLGNGEVAILALAHFLERQRGVHSTESLIDRMAKMYAIVSI